MNISGGLVLKHDKNLHFVYKKFVYSNCYRFPEILLVSQIQLYVLLLMHPAPCVLPYALRHFQPNTIRLYTIGFWFIALSFWFSHVYVRFTLTSTCPNILCALPISSNQHQTVVDWRLMTFPYCFLLPLLLFYPSNVLS